MMKRYNLDGVYFFFNDTATTEIYTLSLHDALPICRRGARSVASRRSNRGSTASPMLVIAQPYGWTPATRRSEEHTSELQSQSNLVCRLLLEKKKNIQLAECQSVRLFPRQIIASTIS